MDTIPVTLRLPREIQSVLTRLCRRHRCQASQVVQEALDVHLAHHLPPLDPRAFGVLTRRRTIRISPSLDRILRTLDRNRSALIRRLLAGAFARSGLLPWRLPPGMRLPQ